MKNILEKDLMSLRVVDGEKLVGFLNSKGKLVQ
jgi:hypothetical protein